MIVQRTRSTLRGLVCGVNTKTEFIASSAETTLKLIRITKLNEVKEYLNRGMIGKGTYSTAKFALEQGKPTYIAIPEDPDEKV